MTTFQNDGGGGDFRPIFQKDFYMKKIQYIHPPKSLDFSYLVIFSILNDRHNQQKFQIFQKFKIFSKFQNNLEFLLIMTVA